MGESEEKSNWFDPYVKAFKSIKNAIGSFLSNKEKETVTTADPLQKYYNNQVGTINQNYTDLKKYYGEVKSDTEEELKSSKATAQQQNYVNYRKLIDKYLPEYLNSSGLYDVGSMSQPFLDAENNYVSSAGEIQQNYDSNMRAAQNEYNKNILTALSDKNSALSELERYKFETEREDDLRAKEKSEENGAIKADELINYIDIGAGEYSGEYDYNVLDNFEKNYAEDLADLQKDYPDDYKKVINYLNAIRNSSGYVDSKEEKEKTDLEEEHNEALETDVTNLTDEGFYIEDVESVSTKSGKNLKISDKFDNVYTVQIKRKEMASDINAAASNLENGQFFQYKGEFYIKIADSVYSIEQTTLNLTNGYSKLQQAVFLNSRGGTLSDEERDFILNTFSAAERSLAKNYSDSYLLNYAVFYNYINIEDGKLVKGRHI